LDSFVFLIAGGMCGVHIGCTLMGRSWQMIKS